MRMVTEWMNEDGVKQWQLIPYSRKGLSFSVRNSHLEIPKETLSSPCKHNESKLDSIDRLTCVQFSSVQ